MMRPWDEVDRSHVSEADKQRATREGYVMADHAIAHFIVEMRKRGLPGMIDIVQPYENKTSRGWAYGSNVEVERSSVRFALLIQESGHFWAIGTHASGGRDYTGSTGWVIRLLDFQKRAFVFWPASGGFENPNDLSTRLTGSFAYSLKGFQLLFVELSRKYGIPLPPSQGSTQSRRRRSS